MPRFWAIELQPGKVYTQTPEADLHISQASLDANAKHSQRNVVHCIVSGGHSFALCSLRLEKVDQCSLNLVFEKGQEVSFAITGQSSVHLTGYYLDSSSAPFSLSKATVSDVDRTLEFGSPDKQLTNGQSVAKVDAPQQTQQPQQQPQLQSALKRKDPTAAAVPTPAKKVKLDPPQRVLATPSKPADSSNDVDNSPPLSKTPATKQTPAAKAAATSQTPSKKPENTPIQLPNGLVIEDVRVGDGREVTKQGTMVEVKYIGKLKNGSVFDASNQRPFVFKWGTGAVIKGWDIGVKGMKVGGRRNLVIPPALAYGREGAPPAIGPNQTLFFEIELVNVK